MIDTWSVIVVFQLSFSKAVFVEGHVRLLTLITCGYRFDPASEFLAAVTAFPALLLADDHATKFDPSNCPASGSNPLHQMYVQSVRHAA